jgi:hypothetical protein
MNYALVEREKHDHSLASLHFDFPAITSQRPLMAKAEMHHWLGR